MIRYIVKRTLWLIPTIVIVAFIIFVLLDLAPGTVVDSMIGGDMTQEEVEALYREYNLDKSVFYRFGIYMVDLVHGNLGISQFTKLSVWDEFFSRFPNTLLLSLSGLVIATLISIPLGIFAAKHAGSGWDSGTTAFTLLGMSMPNFWLGLLFIIIFAYKLRLFPVGGAETASAFVLPAVSTSFVMMATTTRQTRSAMLDNIRADFLRTARAKGVPEREVINKHALRNALIPIITTLGTTFIRALAGSAVVETVFNFPGIGKLTVDAVTRRDVTQVCGCVILTTILYVVLLLVIDLLYAAVDPRIKSQYVSGSKKKKKGGATG